MGNTNISIHVTIVGDTNTGKSTLVSSYTGVDYRDERYHCMDMNMMNTMHTIYENEMFYTIYIHDTSGASLKYCTSMNSCNTSHGVIVCFDIHRPETYHKAKQWVQDIKRNNNPVIMLVGTYRATLNPTPISSNLHIMDYSASQDLIYHVFDVDRYEHVADIFSSIITSCTKNSKFDGKQSNITQEDLSNTVIDNFMDHHGLGQYTTYLKSEGYETMYDLKDMSREDLDAINMKRAHKRKLFKKLGKSSQMRLTDVLSVRLRRLKGLQHKCDALNIKIIVLGNSGVGKTTLIKKLETNLFDANVSATIGVEHHFFKTSNPHRKYPIEVTVIDPSGMEKYRSMTRQSFRDVHGAILVTDISDNRSWEGIRTWTKELKENCLNDDIQIIVLCNKMDKYMDNKIISDIIIQRAQKYSDHHKFRNYNTSSIDVEHGEQVRKAFEELTADIIYDDILLRRLKKEKRRMVKDDKYSSFESPSVRGFMVCNTPPSNIRVDGQLRSFEYIVPHPHHRRSSRCSCNSLNEDAFTGTSLNEDCTDV